MKKALLLLSAACALLNAEISKEWIDSMVSEILPPRSGLEASYLHQLHNPFIQDEIVAPTKSSSKRASSKRVIRSSKGSFTLAATMNNRAKLNNQWYALNETIAGYKIVKITKSYVLLKKNKNTSIIVHLNKSKNNLKMTIK